MADMERRRRRSRHPAHTSQDPASRQAATADVHDGDTTPTRRSGQDERDGDRGLRALVGSGASQVSVAAALRARDASQPTERDLAEAAARMVLVRRHWVPREDLPRVVR